MSKPIVMVSNVTKCFRNHIALNDVSFEISDGAFHALCGEVGAGKTTLMKIIAGSYSSRRYSGVIRLAEGAAVTYIPEKAHFPRGKTLYQYLMGVARLIYRNSNEASTKVNSALKEMGIFSLAKKYPHGFSVGQKQKAVLSRIAIENANVIILDEPLANLDFSAREFLNEKLVEWNKAGKTIVIGTHLVKEIAKYANEITLINYGELITNKKIAVGELERLYNRELSAYTKKQKEDDYGKKH